MNKRLLWALLLIALVVIVLVMNRHSVKVNLVFGDIRAAAAFVFMGFTGVGVAIGALLK